MVRQYYVPQITELSEQELQSVFEAAESPVCLLGGWAVHVQVNDGFQTEHGREYIGSRDIDVGIHVDADRAPDELSESSVGRTLARIQDMGYTRSRFGFVQNFHRDTKQRISEDEAEGYGMHEIFQLYIDVIPDTAELDSFEAAFGFRPPAEPLLQPVFSEDKGEPLSEQVSWAEPADTLIVPAELLASMKIRSLPDRDKSHKRVKDVADLHALLWYVKDYSEMKSQIVNHVTEADLNRLRTAVDEDVFENAATLLQIDPQLIKGSIQRLLR